MFRIINGKKIKFTKKELYKTRKLTTIASILHEPQNEVFNFYDHFDIDKKHNHKRFIDALIKHVTEFDDVT